MKIVLAIYSILWDSIVVQLMVFILLLVTTVFIGLPLVYWVHDYRMEKFEISLRDILLPSGSSVVATNQRF